MFNTFRSPSKHILNATAAAAPLSAPGSACKNTHIFESNMGQNLSFIIVCVCLHDL